MNKNKQKPLPPGTLVRVLPSALSEEAKHAELNQRMVDAHGYLYFIVRLDDDEGGYNCRSLATGRTVGEEDSARPYTLFWFADEIEAPEDNHG